MSAGDPPSAGGRSSRGEPVAGATGDEEGRVAGSARDASVWRRIGRSWLALKTWVKAWLFFLNLVLLGSFFFLHDPVGRWTAIAYLAAGPLLLGMMVCQRGLTRLLGLAHLIPWTPLMVYLVLRVSTGVVGPRLTPADDPALFGFALLVVVTVGVCLAFDLYDVLRWIRGERFVMGTPEAYEAGASGRVTLESPREGRR